MTKEIDLDLTKDILPGDEVYIESLVSDVEWELAISRFIADYWNIGDIDARKKFINNKLNTHEKIQTYFKDEYNYHLPRKLELEFEVSAKALYNPEAIKDHENGWKDQLKEMRTKMTYRLPEPPEQSMQARSLIDYLAVGKAYPFTT